MKMNPVLGYLRNRLVVPAIAIKSTVDVSSNCSTLPGDCKILGPLSQIATDLYLCPKNTSS